MAPSDAPSSPPERRFALGVARSFEILGLSSAVLTVAFTAASIAAYVPDHPELSFVRTYLSDLGATPGWPGILFNTGMLLVAPLRVILVVLLAMRLLELGVSRGLALTTVVIGVVASVGVILMTAVPYSVSQGPHELGILLFFAGTVVVQPILAVIEWRLRALPRLLPVTCMLMVATYVVFAVLLGLYEAGTLPREVPVLPEWLCFVASLVWLVAHARLLGGRARER
jgi:hypothetical membrane protein